MQENSKTSSELRIGDVYGKTGLLFAILTGLLTWPPGLGAQESPAPALSWVRGPGAESCIAGVELGARLEEQMGRETLVGLSRAELVVAGLIALDPGTKAQNGGWRVDLQLLDDKAKVLGRRSLLIHGGACRTLDELVVFVIHVMLDPDAPLLPPRLPLGLTVDTDAELQTLFGHEPTVPPVALAVPHIDAASEQGSTPAQSSREQAKEAEASLTDDGSADVSADKPAWQLGLYGLMVGGAGVLPGVSAGGGGMLRATHPHGWLFELAATAHLPSSVDVGSRQVQFDLAWVEVSSCFPALVGSATQPAGGLRLCGAVQGGLLRAQGQALISGLNARRFTLNVGPRVQWDVALFSGLKLRIALAALVPTVRDRFLGTSNRELVFRMSAVGGQLDLALGMNFF